MKNSVAVESPTDMITCADECSKYRRENHQCTHLKCATVPNLLRRCICFVPLPSDPDQRIGSERWPGLLEVK